MHSPQNTRSHAIVYWLRWFAVLPTAWLASQLFYGAGYLIFSMGGMIDLRASGGIASGLAEFSHLFLSGLACVWLAAWVAPGQRTLIAVALAIVCIALSWVTHILGQPNPGLTNFLHVGGETSGALLGVVLTWLRLRFSKENRLRETGAV